MRLTGNLIRAMDLDKIPEDQPETRKFLERAKDEAAKGLFYMTIPSTGDTLPFLAFITGWDERDVWAEDFLSMTRGGANEIKCKHCGEPTQLKVDWGDTPGTKVPTELVDGKLPTIRCTECGAEY